MDIDEIEQVAADTLDVTVDDMHSRTRRRELVWARQFAIYYCITFQKWNYQGIANHFGRDRTTVNYITKKVPEMIEYDKEFARLWSGVLNRLGQRPDDYTHTIKGNLTTEEMRELCNNVSY